MKKKLLTHQERRERHRRHEFWAIMLVTLIFPALIIMAALTERSQ